MSSSSKHKRIFIDLNHPADFHFFKYLIRRLRSESFEISITARDKECLHELLQEEGLPFRGRGKGSRSLPGKYLHAIYVLFFLAIRMIRFRPGLSLSLSSPYLILLSRILGIKSICYDDTDLNPRLRPLIRLAPVIISPATYPQKLHEGHQRLRTFKEISYLRASSFPKPAVRRGVFFRLTRTDSVHHGRKSGLQEDLLHREMTAFGQELPCILSSEDGLPPEIFFVRDEGRGIHKADISNIHEQLNSVQAFWGNSATMAAEAAILGIPAIFIGTEVFSYLREMEAAGMIHCFSPDEVRASFKKLEEILGDSAAPETYARLHSRLMLDRSDALEYIYGIIQEDWG